MKKVIKSLKFYFLGISFLGILVMVLPLLFEKVFWHSFSSIKTTKYIFISYIGFFIILIGILIPTMQKFFCLLKLKKMYFIDNINTIIIFLISIIPIIIVFRSTLLLVKLFPKHRYVIFRYTLTILLFLRGIRLNVFGVLSEEAKMFYSNHCSEADYPLLPWALGVHPYNILAGINLKNNTKTFEDRIISWTLGVIVKKFSISIDREDKKSRVAALLKMNKQMDEGINIGIFPEGTRLLISKMKEGTVLGEFEEGAFFLAWKKQVPVQPIVFDFPAIFRGKKDDRWGVHPCVIDIHYLNVIRPDEKDEFSENKYKSLEEFQLACFQVMETKLKSSKKVQNFLKEIKER